MKRKFLWIVLILLTSFLSTPVIAKALDKKENSAKLASFLDDLKRSDPAARARALDEIGKMGADAKEAVPILIQDLRDRDKSVRYQAAAALGSIGPSAEEAVPALIRVLKDSDPSARQGAAWVLSKIGERAKDAIPALSQALRDQDGLVRVRAYNALQAIATPEALDASKQFWEVEARRNR